MGHQVKVAVLGLGEAGNRFAADLLQAGATVYGWDPRLVERPSAWPPGVDFAASNRAAAAQADVVFSVNLATAALDVAREVAPALRDRQVFAEFNTASPQLKQAACRIVEPSGAGFVDVAVMAPVPPKGLRTPMLISGNAAELFERLMTPLGMDLEYVDAAPGSAATRKLLRSIAYKGFAAVVTECLEAGRRLGLEEHARQQIATLIDEELIDRFENGSRIHARRRIHEMEAVEELLESIGVAPLASRAALERLRELDATATGSEDD